MLHLVAAVLAVALVALGRQSSMSDTSYRRIWVVEGACVAIRKKNKMAVNICSTRGAFSVDQITIKDSATSTRGLGVGVGVIVDQMGLGISVEWVLGVGVGLCVALWLLSCKSRRIAIT